MPNNQTYISHAKSKITQALKSGATELDLSTMRITELPESLGQLTWLRSLNLFGNRLVKLPKWLGNLTRLQSLDLSYNQLVTIPEWFDNLTQLESLNLSENKLLSLSDSLGRLSQLQSLKLSFNRLTTLPESLGQITNLQEIHIISTPLTCLPDSFSKLSRLETLMLGGNHFIDLPDFIGEYKKLKVLVLGSGGGGMSTKRIPTCIQGLHKLEELWLGFGRLTVLPDWLGTLSSLRVLHAYDNVIQSIPSTVGQLRNLEELDLRNNQLVDIPRSIIQLDYLQNLDLNGNPLNPQLAKAYKRGLGPVKAYLRAKTAEARLDKPLHRSNLKVFFCHASQDKFVVHKLYERLLLEGWIDPWLDAKNLLPGQDWLSEIKNAVETADVVIIFLSKASINKEGFVQKELRLAKDIALEKTEGSIFLIPLRLDETEVPKSLRLYQWANYYGEEQEQTYVNLLESLKHRLEDLHHKGA